MTLDSLLAERNMVYPHTNPFATRWTRPGALPYLGGDSATPAELVERLKHHEWHGAIVGPHGSGKSTLLAMLIGALADAGRRVTLVQLHDGQRRLPRAPQDPTCHGRPGRVFDAASPTPVGRVFDPTCHGRLGRVLAIDGYEQLSRWQRWRIRRQCRRQRCGLLVTSHRECSLPVLVQTRPTLDIVEQLIAEHLPPHGGRITGTDIQTAWNRHGGNVREVFFELYNVFERRPDCKNYNESASDSYTIA
jgi:energy-coupling factor transporter ATP-binding protein EcfA2